MRRPLLFVVLALSLAASGGSVYLLRESSRAAQPSLGKDEHAFLNSRWGMSLKEVESANSSTLLPVADNKRFFNDPGSDDGTRYRSYENRSAKFLGRAATVTYTFRDDRLFAYHVFVTDADGDRLDADMRQYLTKTFGKGASGSDDEEVALKLIWQSKERIVNYWLMEDELSLRSKFTAGFGVTRNEG